MEQEELTKKINDLQKMLDDSGLTLRIEHTIKVVPKDEPESKTTKKTKKKA